MTRYPLQPLLDAAGMTLNDLRQVCPMGGTTYRNARNIGLTEDQADRWSCRCGLLPWLVWPNWLDDAFVACASDVCDGRFVPTRRNHIYCSKRCTVRHAQRAYRARVKDTDAFKEYGRTYSRRYYAEAGEYVRARQRAYNARVKDTAA